MDFRNVCEVGECKLLHIIGNRNGLPECHWLG